MGTWGRIRRNGGGRKSRGKKQGGRAEGGREGRREQGHRVHKQHGGDVYRRRRERWRKDPIERESKRCRKRELDAYHQRLGGQIIGRGGGERERQGGNMKHN